ncbi:hypothetical protein BVC80_901g60 [Macleaya cordata]|uniref:F-box protein At3g26010-like beta-propeller domain-containing protein n=1 Tax=Macleaya cordata TaxID=56857 RepID=A0A200QET2_MACCD|nr:hypothetical protein BVC80_901g60 [Macleaya cordata]
MNRILDSLSPSRPWALFYNLNRPAVEFVSIASPDPHYQFVSAHDGFSFRFLYSVICPYNKEERLYLLASSNGLVLCSNSSAFQSKYYVCNPLTKEWVSLPPPHQTPRAWVLNGFFCESSPSSLTSTSYKVVRIKECRVQPKTNFDLDLFSSDIGEWSSYKVSSPKEITFLYPFLSSVVCCNGILYWIEGRNRIIAYDLNHNNNNNKNGGCQCRLIDLPVLGVGKYYGYLWEFEGFISYSRCQSGQLSVWVLEKYLNRGWVWRLVHKIEINDILTENFVGRRLKEIIEGGFFRRPAYINLKPLAFDPVDPNVLILAYGGVQWYFFGYNMRSRSLQNFRQNCSSRCSLAGEVFPFVFTPSSTTLPPPSWSGT